MSEPRSESEEPLVPNFAAGPGVFDMPADVAALRDKVLRQTTTIVRGRRQRKRVLRMASWGLAYAAGIATAWFGLQAFAPQRPTAVPNIAAQPTTTPEAHLAQAAPKVTPVARRKLSPEELRYRVAGATREEQIELLRQAGDLYLNERNDLRAAVQCYQQVLELSDRPEQFAVLPEDSWLLAELKNSQRSQ